MTTTDTASIETPPQRAAVEKPLHIGTDPPAEPAAIARWIAPQIAGQLERAAWWPGHELRENWKLGDYSVYWIGFPAPGFKSLYVRFISEPDRTGLLEVSASNDDRAFRMAAPDRLRAALAEAGFRPGGNRAGYCKGVLVESREDCEALAHEIAALVTGCLGYDGAGKLDHTHAFLERTEPARVFTGVTLGDVERLLRSSKLVTWARERRHGPGFWTAEKPSFLVAPFMENSPGTGWYRALRFRYTAPMETELAEGLIRVMRSRGAFAEMAAEDGRLRLEHCVLIEGGVTEANLRAQLRRWRGFLATVVAVCRRMEADAED